MKEDVLRIFMKNQLCSFGEIPRQYPYNNNVMFPAAETTGFVAESQ